MIPNPGVTSDTGWKRLFSKFDQSLVVRQLETKASSSRQGLVNHSGMSFLFGLDQNPRQVSFLLIYTRVNGERVGG